MNSLYDPHDPYADEKIYAHYDEMYERLKRLAHLCIGFYYFDDKSGEDDFYTSFIETEFNKDYPGWSCTMKRNPGYYLVKLNEEEIIFTYKNYLISLTKKNKKRKKNTKVTTTTKLSSLKTIKRHTRKKFSGAKKEKKKEKIILK